MLKYLIIGLLLISNLTLSLGVYIRICNHGVYLAQCYLESRTFTFGFQIYRFKTGLFPILQCSRFDIPLDAEWSSLECKALTFIAIYQSIFIEESSGSLNTCYTLTGSILNPSWSKTHC